MKSVLFTAASAVAGIAGCQAPAPSQPAEPRPQPTCVVTYAVNHVPDVPAGCQLNLIFPTFEQAAAFCDGPASGERRGYPDTCYDVDY